MNQDVPLGYLASNGVALAPSDSLGHAVELLQDSRSGAVPVLENGQLCGLVSDREVARGLARDEAAPVSAVMTRAVPVAPAAMPARDGLRLLSETDFPALPVMTPDGYFLGTVGRAEILSTLFRRRRPAMVGGMATPLGVYLSDGTVRGGAGDLALMLTGLFLFTGSIVASALGFGAVRLAVGWGLSRVLPLGWLAAGVFLVAFALWFRLSWIAGYHAAEHQTVHAIERNEPLTVERVARMPRPHPRCGTNIAVLFVMFTTLVGILHINEAVAGIFSLVTYRFWGYWVQQHVTTRPATKKQLENGIRAGEEVLERYQSGVAPSRFFGLRRVWNMGLMQVAAGYFVAWALFWLLGRYVPFVGALVRSLQ